jgi:flagellar biosynthesis protein FlhF
MKVKKFTGKTSREVLSQVRAELGSDAVILSNRQTRDGIEILAVAEQHLSELATPTPLPRVPKPALPVFEDPLPEPVFAARAAPQPAPLARPAVQPAPVPFAALAKTQERVEPTMGSAMQAMVGISPTRAKAEPIEPAPLLPIVHNAGLDPLLMEEIKMMRGMLEGQLAQLAWNETTRRRPLRMKLMQEMLTAGFSPALSRLLTERLPDDFSPAQAEQWLKMVLAKNLNCVPAEVSLVDRGGVYALVGPTGVGKTTTTAKLAARCVVKYGAQKLGLITTDSYRIGAHDQLRIYGKILGVQVHTVQDESALETLLASMRDKHLVLIDTVGMSQRDQRVAEQVNLLSDLPIKRILLLNASSQAETLEDVINAYRGRGLFGAILTKIDEAVKLGGALDCVVRHKLALQFIANGQRVPEDLHNANGDFLVHRALKAATPRQFALQEEDFQLLAAPSAVQGRALAW